MFNRGIADLQREGLWPIGDQREHLANVTLSAQLAIAVKKLSVDVSLVDFIYIILFVLTYFRRLYPLA